MKYAKHVSQALFVKIVRRAGSCDASYGWGRRQGKRKKLS